MEEDETDEAGGDEPTSPPEPPVTEDGGETGTGQGGTLIAPVPLDKTGAIAVDGGRVTVLAVETAQSIAAIEITDAPAQGTVTVNPDNTLALVLSGNDFSGSLSFGYKITYANGATETRSAALTVAAPEQQAGWGQGKHYMLETDAQGDLVIETGDNHRKVYVSGSDTALTRADIAAREGVSESKVTGKWLLDHAEYGGSEGMALATDIGMDLWFALHPITAEPDPSSNWLLFEKGYEYEGMGGTSNARLITAGYSGESPLQPIYISSWGRASGRSSRTRSGSSKLESQNIVFDDIAPEGGIISLGGSNIIVNDSAFTGLGLNIQNVDGFTLRDSDLSHIIVAKPDGEKWSGIATGLYAGKTDGILLENNVFHHIGWEDGYRMDGSTQGGMPPNMLSHNVYLQNNTTDVTFRDNITAQASSIGAQIRGGGFVEDNVFLDNNVAVNLLGGVYQGEGPIGNYTFFADNLITSGAHKNTDLGMGGLTMGLTDKGYDTAFLDNIIAHLADPANPAELAAKPTTHPAFQSENGIAYDDTIIYNWKGSGRIGNSVTDNGKVTDTARADQTTIQNFAAQVSGQGQGHHRRADGRHPGGQGLGHRRRHHRLFPGRLRRRGQRRRQRHRASLHPERAGRRHPLGQPHQLEPRGAARCRRQGRPGRQPRAVRRHHAAGRSRPRRRRASCQQRQAQHRRHPGQHRGGGADPDRQRRPVLDRRLCRRPDADHRCGRRTLRQYRRRHRQDPAAGLGRADPAGHLGGQLYGQRPAARWSSTARRRASASTGPAPGPPGCR